MTPHFRVGTRTQPLGQAITQLQDGGVPQVLECLSIGIGADKLYPVHTAAHHMADSVSATASDAYYFDFCAIRCAIHDLKHDKYPSFGITALKNYKFP